MYSKKDYDNHLKTCRICGYAGINKELIIVKWLYCCNNEHTLIQDMYNYLYRIGLTNLSDSEILEHFKFIDYMITPSIRKNIINNPEIPDELKTVFKKKTDNSKTHQNSISNYEMITDILTPAYLRSLKDKATSLKIEDLEVVGKYLPKLIHELWLVGGLHNHGDTIDEKNNQENDSESNDRISKIFSTIFDNSGYRSDKKLE